MWYTVDERQMNALRCYDKIKDVVRHMTSQQIRKYECQFIDDERVMEERYRPQMCDDCGYRYFEDDINIDGCPCGLDFADLGCMRSFIYTHAKTILVEEDFILRVLLGDMWTDEFTDFIGGLSF